MDSTEEQNSPEPSIAAKTALSYLQDVRSATKNLDTIDECVYRGMDGMDIINGDLTLAWQEITNVEPHEREYLEGLYHYSKGVILYSIASSYSQALGISSKEAKEWTEKARESFASAVKVAPLPLYKYHLGLTLKTMDRLPEALQVFESAASDNNPEVAMEARKQVGRIKLAISSQSPPTAPVAATSSTTPVAPVASPVTPPTESGMEELISAVNEGNLQKVSELCERGADNDPTDHAQGQWRNGLLCRAAWWGYADIVEYLIERGANVAYTEEQQGHTALFIAAMQGNVEAASVLINHGSDVNFQEERGWTPVITAVQNYADDEDEVDKQRYLDVVELLANSGANLNTKDMNGFTPLRTLIGDFGKDVDFQKAQRHLKMAELLLKSGADINARDGHEDTPLHRVAHNTNVAGFLLDRGADLEARNDMGGTPLILAAALNRHEMLSYLMGRGANAGAKDNSGNTALQIAQKSGNTKAVNLLQNRSSVASSQSADHPVSAYAQSATGISSSPQIPSAQTFSLSQVQSNPEATVIAVTMAVGGAMLLSLFLPWAQVSIGSASYIQLCQLILQASSSGMLNNAPLSLLFVFVPGFLALGVLGRPFGAQGRKFLAGLLKGPLERIDPKGYEKEMRPRPHRYLWELIINGGIGVFACFFVYSKLSGVGAGSMNLGMVLSVGFYLFSLASLFAVGFGVWGLSAIPNVIPASPVTSETGEQTIVTNATPPIQVPLSQAQLQAKGRNQEIGIGAGIGAIIGIFLTVIIGATDILYLQLGEKLLFGISTGAVAGAFAVYYKERITDIPNTCKMGAYSGGAMGGLVGVYLSFNQFFGWVMGLIFGGVMGLIIGIAAGLAVRHFLPLIKQQLKL